MTSPLTKSTATLDFMKNKKFFTNYAEEIMETLFEDEQTLIQIRHRSDQLEIRPMLIDLLQAFARHYEYSLATLHLAVHILDCYMDSYILSDFVEHQKLIGIVCLLLAAKSEDIDENIPSIKDLLKIVDMTNDLGVDMRFKEELDPKELSKIYRIFSALYCKLEFLIFESLDFNTIRPTAVTFINIFQSIVVTADDVKSFGVANLKSLGDLRVLANDYLKQFLEIIIQDIEFFNKLPSQLAASIIGATRKLLHISHFWNDSLAQLTRCRIEDIRLLIVTLIEKRNNAIREKSNCDLNDVFKDSGFISPTSSEAEDECKKVVKKRKLNRKVVTYEV